MISDWNFYNGSYLDLEYNELDKAYRRRNISFDGMQPPTEVDTIDIFNNKKLFDLNEFYKNKFQTVLYDFKEFEYEGEKYKVENRGYMFNKLIKSKVEKVNYLTFRK